MASTTLTNTKIKETYVGVLHSNGTVLPTTGQEDIYDGGGNKSSIKIGRACNGVTICGPLSCSSISIGNIKTLIDVLYPINSIFLSTDNTNPGIRFVGTTWSQSSSGRFLAGVGTGNDGTTNYTVAAGNFNGEYNHTLTTAEMPTHDHTPSGTGNVNPIGLIERSGGASPRNKTPSAYDTGGSGDEMYVYSSVFPLNVIGGNQAHNNIPPGFGIYVWKRTA
jgi:microcystin-dependent protein